MRNDYRFSSHALVILTFAANVYAQGATIPARLAREGASLGSGPSIPSGPSPSLDRILAETDTIVRGVVGEPRSYLSDDQMDVYTDYPLRNPVFLYQAVIPGSKRIEMPTATVTLLGGTITINGLSFASKHEALPSLEPGTECVFLLKQVGSRYHIAGMYYGVFRVTGTVLTPVTKKSNFAPELQAMSALKAAEEMVTRTRGLRTAPR